MESLVADTEPLIMSIISTVYDDLKEFDIIEDLSTDQQLIVLICRKSA